MTELLPTFEVDKEGLRKVLARKGMGWLVPELVQNAWDEDVSTVNVELKWIRHPDGETKGLAHLSVEDDDPNGFTEIGHAFTLFAESEKKSDAERRGRFNVGEKLVVAVCNRAEVSTTTGRVVFTEAGREMLPAERKQGSIFYGEVELTQAEFDEALDVARMLLPPKGVHTFLNGEQIHYRECVRAFNVTLRTPVGAELKIRDRKTTVRLHQPLGDETPHLYEMGIPVVALIEGGDRWHVDIGQKVPLNVDRDNVTPAYLRVVRRIVLDHAHDLLSEQDAAQDWTTDAIQDDGVGESGLHELLKLRFGDKYVSQDVNDPEANKIAVSEGYTVIKGGMLPKDAWKNIKQHGLIKPAGQVTPSPKPYEPGQDKNRIELAQDEWTPGIWRVANFSRYIAYYLLGADVKVAIVSDPACMNFAATYGRGPGGKTGELEFNLRVLGRKWFDTIGEEQLSLILHELGHGLESDHLSRDYYRALTDLGARLSLLVAAKGPAWWDTITTNESDVLAWPDVQAEAVVAS